MFVLYVVQIYSGGSSVNENKSNIGDTSTKMWADEMEARNAAHKVEMEAMNKKMMEQKAKEASTVVATAVNVGYEEQSIWAERARGRSMGGIHRQF